MERGILPATDAGVRIDLKFARALIAGKMPALHIFQTIDINLASKRLDVKNSHQWKWKEISLGTVTRERWYQI
jgi:hypothetical protein